MHDLSSQTSDEVHLNVISEFHNTANHSCEATPCGYCFLHIGTMECDEGHAVCPRCLEDTILGHLDLQSQKLCPFDDCSSDHEYLRACRSRDIYEL
jgi:hypothetical protein